ncbi:O-antigen ligase family protein [Halomonas sp. GD1P12]|uniref:O-antigen ligase family protein n=1 Tax=Halomonas sp. GD1P12 TaxID=2982691 RepID=UPI0021E4C602|nr:O-antigen ligase family protein [Halomonas sp. GD1P12]UYF98738.1 O-antigen ligase family protein [Halomonas sp. GD1P12]
MDNSTTREATLPAGPLARYVSVCVFLMGALALVVPSGYSIGAALLLLASVCLLSRRVGMATLTRQDRWLIAALCLYGLAVGVLSTIELGARGFDRPSRFLLAVPVLLLVLRCPPRLSWLWSGLALGAIGSGSWALWQNLALDRARADGFVYVIQFGNLSMLMGVLCLAGLGWAFAQRRRAFWLLLLLLGAFLGMLGSLLSGSRGGWIGLPFIAFVLYRGYGRGLSLKVKAAAVALMLAVVVIMYATPQTGVQQRVHAGINDVAQYIGGGERDTSLGLRFQMWRGAGLLIAERPVLGWGEQGYVDAMQALAERGVINPAAAGFDHAHNEFIDATAKRGVVGLAILLALYLVPMRLFVSGFSHADLRVRSLAVAGTLLPVAYIDFGLSQTFMAHNSGAMFYAFWLAVWWGAYSAYRCQSAAVAASFTR